MLVLSLCSTWPTTPATHIWSRFIDRHVDLSRVKQWKLNISSPVRPVTVRHERLAAAIYLPVCLSILHAYVYRSLCWKAEADLGTFRMFGRKDPTKGAPIAQRMSDCCATVLACGASFSLQGVLQPLKVHLVQHILWPGGSVRRIVQNPNICVRAPTFLLNMV